MTAQLGDAILMVLVPVLAAVWIVGMLASALLPRDRRRTRWRDESVSAGSPRIRASLPLSPDSDNQRGSGCERVAGFSREKITGTMR